MPLAAVPPLSREEAAERAADELARPGYARSWQERAWDAVLDLLDRVISGAAGATPGGLGTLLVVAVLVVVAVLALRGRIGPLATARTPGVLDSARTATAADHRAAADAAAAEGRYADALRERLRAVSRDLEARGLLLPRPGRTAAELAREGGAALPGTGHALAALASRFDDVWYGGADATREDDERARAVDALLREARPATPAATPAGSPP